MKIKQTLSLSNPGIYNTQCMAEVDGFLLIAKKQPMRGDFVEALKMPVKINSDSFESYGTPSWHVCGVEFPRTRGWQSWADGGIPNSILAAGQKLLTEMTDRHAKRAKQMAIEKRRLDFENEADSGKPEYKIETRDDKGQWRERDKNLQPRTVTSKLKMQSIADEITADEGVETRVCLA